MYKLSRVVYLMWLPIFSLLSFFLAGKFAYAEDIQASIFVPVNSTAASYDYLRSVSDPFFDAQVETAKQAIEECGIDCIGIDEIEIRYVPNSMGNIGGQRVWPLPGAVRPTPWMDLEEKDDGKLRLHLLVSEMRFLTDVWIIDARPPSSEIPMEMYSISRKCYSEIFLTVDDPLEVGQSRREALPECIPNILIEPFLSYLPERGHYEILREITYEHTYHRGLLDRKDRVRDFHMELYPALLRFMLDSSEWNESWYSQSEKFFRK